MNRLVAWVAATTAGKLITVWAVIVAMTAVVVAVNPIAWKQTVAGSAATTAAATAWLIWVGRRR